jgi:hypothetical protein
MKMGREQDSLGDLRRLTLRLRLERFKLIRVQGEMKLKAVDWSSRGRSLGLTLSSFRKKRINLTVKT